MVRVLTSRDLERNVSFLEIVDAVEASYRATADGSLVGRPRVYLTAPGTHTTLSVSPAMSAGLGVGVFAYTGGNKSKGLPQKLALLFDPTDGGLSCLIESDWLSWARTGASSAVATRHMARPDASAVGIIGSGKQARSQLLAIAASRPIERAVVFSPDEERRTRYAIEMSEACGFPVQAVDHAAEVLEVAEIICTATTSREPVLDGRALRPGTHVNAIGQHYADRRELDTEAVRRSHVVVDELESAFKEYGELCIPLDRGEISRDHGGAITVFLSGGVSGEYLAAVNAVWLIAQARGLGFEIDLGRG
jgi:ornithine cyclodeaminase/alanine dehydrogenase-like protein (mu-crystallin family)